MVFQLLALRELEVTVVDPQTPAESFFHQMVGRVHRRVQQVRHGIPPEESRTTLEGNESNMNKFVAYFKEELKDQMKGKPPNKL